MFKPTPSLLALLIATVGTADVAAEVAMNEPRAPVFDRYTELDSATVLAELKQALQVNGFSDIAVTSEPGLRFTRPDVAARITGADPAMAAMFPLRLTLVAADQGTRIEFPRPTAHSPGQGAANAASQLEESVVQSIESAITGPY